MRRVVGGEACAARRVRKIAPRVVLPLEILATIVFLFLMWETRLAHREALQAVAGRQTILAKFSLLVISMLVGWFIGGPDRESRRVLVTSTGMRSVIVVLYVARYCFPGTNVYMIPIVCLSLMVPANLLFHLPSRAGTNCGLRRRRHRLHQNGGRPWLAQTDPTVRPDA